MELLLNIKIIVALIAVLVSFMGVLISKTVIKTWSTDLLNTQ